MFKNYSRANLRKSRGYKALAPPVIKATTTRITKAKIGNLIKDMNIEILNSLFMQLGTLHLKRKQDKMERYLSIYVPNATKRTLTMSVFSLLLLQLIATCVQVTMIPVIDLNYLDKRQHTRVWTEH